jgi:nucleotide-binding universal stress UspA family protein
MTPAAEKKKSVVWAVDLFAEDFLIQSTTLDALEQIAPALTHRIHPVCVWPVPPLDTPLARRDALVAEVESRARARLAELVQGRGLDLVPLTVLTEPAPSRQDQASALVKHAAALDADLIALSCHTRRKASHYFLGSFAEALCLASPIPLLLTHPETRFRPRIDGRHVLFATDFSAESVRAFLDLVVSAKKNDWSIAVFHKVIFPFLPMDERAAAYYGIADQVFRDYIESAREEGGKLVSIARKNGVQARLVLNEERSSDAEAGILHELSSSVYHLMALTARSGRFLTSRLGRTTRELARSSPVPVWIIHPDFRRARTEESESLETAWVRPQQTHRPNQPDTMET